MSVFIEGTCRTQATLFPDRLDDYIGAENAIRVIDAFIDSLDLSNLGFKPVPADTSITRPPCSSYSFMDI